MYIVTGGTGFIGSKLVHELNRNGITDILIVDHFGDSRKLLNLHGDRFTDYMDRQEFRRAITSDGFGSDSVQAIFHHGACSNTLVDAGVYMMDNDFTCSKEVLDFAVKRGAALVYTSTTGVYGLSGPGRFTPALENEKPLNIYGVSKLTFDNYLRHRIATESLPITAVGLRYFNVCGPREQHKDRMASVIHHFSRQILQNRRVRLFEGRVATARESSGETLSTSVTWRGSICIVPRLVHSLRPRKRRPYLSRSHQRGLRMCAFLQRGSTGSHAGPWRRRDRVCAVSSRPEWTVPALH